LRRGWASSLIVSTEEEDKVSRFPIATRDSVPEDQREAFDEIVQRLGKVPQYGPESVMIRVPHAHRWVAGLGNYLRNESTLSRKIQELAMLVTAREMDCQHIWNAHAPTARSVGVPASLVDALRDGTELAAVAPDEEAVVNLGQEFFRTHKVSPSAFQAALDQFGERGVVELTMTMANYSLFSFAINVFETDLPPNRTEPLLPI
jgi:4-carboxymuconolactone decarboxylase